jgi:hypothetical protein
MEPKDQLKKLTDEFDDLKTKGKLDQSSEATARTWIEELLKIFGWNTKNPSEIDQEYQLNSLAKKNLKKIESKHSRPDYVFKKGKQLLQYLDAKKISVNIEQSKEAAFQIRSYGWSTGLPCSIVSDFEEFAVYDCRYKPSDSDKPEIARIRHIMYYDYVDNYDFLNEHLSKELLYSGRLHTLYPVDVPPKGAMTLDLDFTDRLRKTRKELAQIVWKQNQKFIDKNPQLLSIIVQIILDRIVFIRICEGKGIESDNLLGSMANEHKESFWNEFVKQCKEDFTKHYDGPMFPDISEVDKISLSGDYLGKFIETLYFPYPYRFDVMPIDLLGNIYEKFLGYRIFFKGNSIKDDFRPEYQRTKGAIYTPRYIVDDICERVISPLTKEKSIEKILELKVCDISCGSGSFLLGVFDHIENAIIEYFIKNLEAIPEKYNKWYFKDTKNQIYLTSIAKRAIIENCIYGVDLDSEAIEVTKMALALKILENSEMQIDHLDELGLRDREILKGIGKNIRQGNSLVDLSAIDSIPGLKDDRYLLTNTLPFDFWDSKNFKYVKDIKGGFDAIVGNPPYIETKHFKESLPAQYQYIKDNYETGKDGKTDIAVPFIERAINLLNNNGRLGYIVQNRFFKTKYGKATRNLLNSKNLIEEIIDFGELKIFQNRMTYTCTLILNKKKHSKFNYYKVNEMNDIWEVLANIRNNKKQNIMQGLFKVGSLGDGTWSFNHPELIEMKMDLLEKFGSLGDVSDIKIKVGLQVLWDKAYHIIPEKVEKGIIYGKNRLGNKVNIEEKACVKMICNEQFYTWRKLKPDVYAIFPYQVNDSVATGLQLKVFESMYPFCGNYLKENKKLIKEEVDCPSGEQYWHQYKYKKNLISQTEPKLIIPMTATDTFATFDEKGDYYLDNVNVNSIHILSNDKELLVALSCIINTRIFSFLARLIANPQSGGYLKLNKQFLEPIPFPWKSLKGNTSIISKLNSLASDIIKRQDELLIEKKITVKEVLKDTLKSYWDELDNFVEDELYQLNTEQKNIIKKHPRTVDRIEMLMR